MLSFLKTGQKILGINARNLLYIQPSNTKKALRIADHKLLAKRILKEAGLPVPQTYGVIRSRQELAQFNWDILGKSFALKPNRGLGGEGILIVYGRKKNNPETWVKADRSKISKEDLENHILNILDGNF